MLKVCFVKLKENWCADPYSDPPLGLLSVIAASKNVSFKGKSLDLQLFDMAHETEIPDAEVYAFSACTLDYPELLKVATQVKEQGSTVVVGGPHFDALPVSKWEKEIENLPIDYICRGEGEVTFSNAIKLIEDGKQQKKIIIQKPPFLDLNSIELPAREFLNKDFYFKPGKVFGGDTFKPGNSTTMMTSRGCPYNCGFCASPELHHRKVRYRGTESVKNEINLLKEVYGVTEIRFQDDCFTLNPKRFKELSHMLSQTGINYRCSMRVDQADNGTLEMLWKSGCREIGFGIESAENNVLNLLEKGTNISKNMDALKKTKERGFKVRAFMMTGLPGETKNSAQKMIDFLEKSNPDVVTLTSFIPLPGCDIYSNPEKYGIKIISSDWAQYNIALKRESKTPFMHTMDSATTEEMEINREKLKEYLFNRNLSNVTKYNKEYRSDVLNKD